MIFETKLFALELPQEYPIVCLMAVLIAFECLVFGLVVTGAPRREYFTKEFLQQFGEMHV